MYAGTVSRMASAPSRSASLLSSMLFAVSLSVVPAITAARSPTACLISEYSRSFSSAESVGDSPVVPVTTSPSLPDSTSASASLRASS